MWRPLPHQSAQGSEDVTSLKVAFTELGNDKTRNKPVLATLQSATEKTRKITKASFILLLSLGTNKKLLRKKLIYLEPYLHQIGSSWGLHQIM